MPNPNMQNANMPNVKVPNPKMSMRHSPECNNVTTRHSAEMPRGRCYKVQNVPTCRITTDQTDKLSNFPTTTYYAPTTTYYTSNDPTLLGCSFFVTILPLGAYLG
jgi:hypothetical protein